jgi:DNA-directed RNA polymerase specialized sigma24 family protein
VREDRAVAELGDEGIEIEMVVEPPSADRATVTTPAFAELYAAEFDPLVRLATLMCGRVEVARDIVQEAFVRLHMHWPTVRDPLAYVRRSVVNGCRSQARWERRRRGTPVGVEPWVEDPHDELGDALMTLNHRQRAAIVLRFYEQRSEAEIAHALGCRPGTVGSLIHRGLGRLRETIER